MSLLLLLHLLSNLTKPQYCNPSTMVTLELLDALLSPDAGRRRQTEEYFQALPLESRVQGLLGLAGQNHLAAVLLRRDVLKMADAESLVDPLLSAFLASSSTTRTALGHCLAEVCGTVAILSPNNTDAVMAKILNAVSGVVSTFTMESIDK